MKNQMRLLGIGGDTKIEWDIDSKDEVDIAKKTFSEYTKKGFKAFRVTPSGKQDGEIKEFDPKAEKILLIPQMRGGSFYLHKEKGG